MQRFFDAIQSQTGKAIPGAIITVYNSGGGLATIYSDNGVSVTGNPLVSNQDGEYAFYAANGTYTLVISASGFTTETRTGVLLFDPAESDFWSRQGNSIANTEFLGSTNAQDLVFRTNNAERMRINSAGNISISGVTYTFPGVQGTANSALVNNGSGVLSWSTSGLGSSKVTKSNVSLGTQAGGQANYTWTTVTTVCTRGLVSQLVVTADAAGLFDIQIRDAGGGAGNLWLEALDINYAVFNLTSPVYIEGTAGTIYVGIRNRAGSSRTFTLTSLRVEAFAL